MINVFTSLKGYVVCMTFHGKTGHIWKEKYIFVKDIKICHALVINHICQSNILQQFNVD